MQTASSGFHFGWYTVLCKRPEDRLCVCLCVCVCPCVPSVRRTAGAVSVRVQQRWWGCCGSWFRVRASCQSTAGAACWAVGEGLLFLCPPPPSLHPNHCHCCAEGQWHRGTSTTAANTISIFSTCILHNYQDTVYIHNMIISLCWPCMFIKVCILHFSNLEMKKQIAYLLLLIT